MIRTAQEMINRKSMKPGDKLGNYSIYLYITFNKKDILETLKTLQS